MPNTTTKGNKTNKAQKKPQVNVSNVANDLLNESREEENGERNESMEENGERKERRVENGERNESREERNGDGSNNELFDF